MNKTYELIELIFNIYPRGSFITSSTARAIEYKSFLIEPEFAGAYLGYWTREATEEEKTSYKGLAGWENLYVLEQDIIDLDVAFVGNAVDGQFTGGICMEYDSIGMNVFEKSLPRLKKLAMEGLKLSQEGEQITYRVLTVWSYSWKDYGYDNFKSTIELVGQITNQHIAQIGKLLEENNE